MKCNACGAPLDDDDAVFCSQCGRKIEAPEDVIEAAAVPEPVDESAGVYEEVKNMRTSLLMSLLMNPATLLPLLTRLLSHFQ